MINIKPIFKVDDKEKDKSVEKVKTWSEFIDNTTFHGVKYIFSGSNRIRRILWFVAVTTAIVVFVSEVGVRVADFFERKTNVAVQVRYTKKLDFPSVTLCNENHYRITATAEWELYDFVDSLFSKNAEHRSVRDYEINDINTRDFVVSTAHQKEDLIDRCTWHGKTCNLTKEFKTILTDLGVCYTFNFEQPPLSVRESGVRNALSLLLNVEQYEYMRGPQIDAGVKILLHDQGQVPQMKDQGFAVAPGTHTLVGIDKFEVESLPDPYGECKEDYFMSVNECQLDCMARAVVENCSCHDVYMKPQEMTNMSVSDICDMDKKFRCVPHALEAFYEKAGGCHCPVPCYRVKYKPVLSYAQLSRINVEGYIITDREKRKKLQDKFLNASETAQRHVRSIVDKDEDMMTELLKTTRELTETLNKTDEIIQHPKLLFVNGKAVNVRDVMDEDAKTMTIFFKAALMQLSRIHQINEGLDRLYEIMVFENNGTVSRTEEFLKFCSGTDDQSITMINKKGADVSLTWINVKEVSECNTAFEDLKIQLRNVANEYFKNHSQIESNFLNGTVEFGSNEEHEEYQDKIEGTIEQFKKCSDLIEKIIKTENFNEAASLVEQIQFLYADLLGTQPTREKLRETGRWITEIDNQIQETQDEFERRALEAKNYLTAGPSVLFNLMTSLAELHTTITEQVVPVVTKADGYMKGEKTKTELSDHVSSKPYLEAIEHLSYLNTETMNFMRKYNQTVRHGFMTLAGAYSKVTELQMPIIPRNKVNQLELVQAAAEINDDRMKELVDSLQFWPCSGILAEIIELSYNRTRNVIDDMVLNISHPVKNLLDQLKEFNRDLGEYKVSTTMDKDFFMENFMQVDIFYQELSYEEIEQNIAFGFVSLLSEVGGFLGLLLGASVLTVCELVDYMTLATVSKIKKKQ